MEIIMLDRIRLCFLVLVTLAVGAVFAPARAGWSVVKSFGSQVRSVYFLDQQSAAAKGFVGLSNSTIWLTTNDGATWNQAATPYYSTPEQITDFAFKDSLVGWCTVGRTYETGQIWKTIDGGMHWDSCFSGGGFVSVAFCAATNIVVATCWSDGNDSSVLSTDFGASWSNFAPPWLNGATFSGANGYIGNISANYPLHSSDGGATWTPVYTLPDETWSPHGIVGTNAFVAVGDKSQRFFSSSDGGATWTNTYTFPPAAEPTGSVRGTLTNLFVQTKNGGFYYSSDSGSSWASVCGPNSSWDTRFYPKGREVFAGDASGNLWHTPDGGSEGQSVLSLGFQKLVLTGVRCLASDSVLYFEFGAGCDAGTLESAQLTSGTGAFSLGNDSLPRTFSGLDSLRILYSPSTSLHDTGTVALRFQLNGHFLDTTIQLIGAGRAAFLYIADTASLTSSSACQSFDTTVFLHNRSCDTLTLWSTSIANNPTFRLLPLPLPYKIPPGDSIGISFSAASGQIGMFRSTLKFTVVSQGLPYTADSTPIILRVLTGAQVAVGELELSLLDICQTLDTAISIESTPCSPMTLLGASLDDTSVFHLGLISLPKAIAPAGTLLIPLHIRPTGKGTYSTTLDLQYQSGGVTLDTIIAFSVQVLYDLPLKVGVADSAFDLGTANVPCEAVARWITFDNSLCADLSIKRIIWLTPTSEFWFDPLPLPVTLASGGGVDSVLVHFQPGTAGSASSLLDITLDLNGTDFDTVLTISATGVLRYGDSLLTPSLQYDSIAECLTSEREAEILDLTCDSVVATSAILAGNEGYSILGTPLPDTLARGDTLRIPFELQPKVPGPAPDFATVTLHDLRNDSDYFDTIQLGAYVLAGRHALSMSSSSFSLPAIAPCTTQDSVIILTNRGCDDVVITDTTLAGYPGVEFVPPLVLPVTIHPDSSATISFRIVPDRDTLEGTTISFRGQNIDTSIAFSYAALPAPPTLTFSEDAPSATAPDSIFITRPCVPVTNSFWIANTGCADASVDSIVLAQIQNASQFSLPQLPALPTTLIPGDTLRWTVTFDPSANGDGLASLRIGMAAMVRTLSLSGRVAGTVPTARVGIQAADGSLQSSGAAADTTSIVAVFLDGIGDTTSLSTVTITLAANWNILTPIRFSPAPGWSVVNTNTSADGSFNIQLRNNSIDAVTAGTKLLNIACYINVTDSMTTNIALTNVRFNADDSNYESCVLASIPMSEYPVRFTETDTCGAPELREELEAKLALKIVSIQPNPAPLEGDVAKVGVTFALGRAASVHFVVRDVIGREYGAFVEPFSAGTHAVELELPRAAQGTYFVQLEANGAFANAKAMVQNSGMAK